MAAPAIPQSFYVQTGNGQILASWAITTGATSYTVQRSTDGVTFTTVSTAAATQYLDTAVTLGTQYFYQVAAIGASGTSAYTTAQSAVPVTTGEMCLSQIRLQSQQRADRVNSNFVTLTEWNTNINQSLFELYDLLVTCYEDYFLAPAVQFTTNGSQVFYPIPDGVTTFINNNTGLSFTPQALYKLRGVDLAINTNSNGWVTVQKFNFIDRNKFLYPNSASTIYGVFNCQYRMMGTNIEFIPTPAGQQIFRLWYVPRLQQLLQDTDTTTAGVSGWIEYVIVDAAIKALQKEESDTIALMVQKQALIKRIQDSAMNRDEGQPDTISDVRSSMGSFGGPYNGFKGGW